MINPSYKAVLFDLDGTLINTGLYIVANYIHLFEKYPPIKMPSLEEMVYFSGPPLSEVFAKWLPEYDQEILKEEFLNFSLKNSNRLSSLYLGEKEVLSFLKKKGVRLGLITNKSERAMKDNISYFGLSDFFSVFYPLEKCLLKKPDPWPLLAAAKDLNVAPDDVLYIGDDEADIKAAHSAKMDSGLVIFGLKKMPEDLFPTYRFRSYEEIERTVLCGKNH